MTPSATISCHSRHGGHNISYHITHVVESLCDILHLSQPSPYSLHSYYEVISRSKFQNSPMAVHKLPSKSWYVNNLQNKSFNLPISSPYALDSKSVLKFHPFGKTLATCGHRVDSCWFDINAWRLGRGVWWHKLRVYGSRNWLSEFVGLNNTNYKFMSPKIQFWNW